MLTGLSIRDIVLIEKLDLTLEPGLTVLTGETGAGKSILLDALGLALGARGDSALVRTGAPKGTVTATFALSRDHAALKLLGEQDIEIDEGELILRRVQHADGKSRAAINDQPVSVNLLSQVAATLTEIHGQHDDRALVDASEHRRLLDAFAGLDGEAADVTGLWNQVLDTRRRAEEQRARVARAEAEREFITHAVEELNALDPQPEEETKLAKARQIMMHAEQFAEAIGEAEDALNGDGAVEARLNAALRKLERRKDQAGGRLDSVTEALDRLLHEMNDARLALDAARRSFAFDPRDLEKSEERLFALRAAARKYKCTVDALASVRERMQADLKSIEDGGRDMARLDAEHSAAMAAFEGVARQLSLKRKGAAVTLAEAVMAELPPLKLERARFEVEVDSNETRPGAHGFDSVEFLVAANPGTPLQPLIKVASGGELARFMLALKVILAAKGSAPTLIFDEIDTGVGGAVADAIGVRLAKLSRGLQVLAVTHSPQVAARASRHLLISKMAEVGGERMVTRVQELGRDSRREEIARMLSGAKVTDEARAQADRLLTARR
jgi:DNA repair protein RecN (Recombination protein N)